MRSAARGVALALLLSLVVSTRNAEAADPTPTPTPFPAQDPEATPEPSPTPRGLPVGFDDAIQLPVGATPVTSPSPRPVSTPLPHYEQAQPRTYEKPWPLQFALAGGVNATDDRVPGRVDGIGFAALSIGGAWSPLGRPHDSGPFVGAALEGTVNGANGPYQWSAGAGPRVGYAWRGGLEGPISDAYVYARVTPFLGMRRIADPGYLHADEEPNLSQSGAGVRVGVGVVAPVWTSLVLGGLGSGPSNVSVSSPEEALACLVFGALVVLTNHVELTWEIYDEPGLEPATLVGLRLGAGF